MSPRHFWPDNGATTYRYVSEEDWDRYYWRDRPRTTATPPPPADRYPRCERCGLSEAMCILTQCPHPDGGSDA